MYIALAVVALGLLIALHELGHLWAARQAGMRVERYSLGFGPVLLRRQVGETEFVLCALPLGGYVRIAGLATDDGTDPEDPRSFANRPARWRLWVIGAGPLANYLLSYLIGVPLLMFAATRDTTRLAEVRAGMPAARAGLQAGDDVRRVGGREVATFDELRRAIRESASAAPGAPVAFEVDRAGSRLSFQLVPERSGGGFVVGIDPASESAPGMPAGAALVQGARNLWLQTAGTAALVGELVHRRTLSGLGGPIAIVRDVSSRAKRGLVAFLSTMWGLGVAVGFFNLLPLPGLDGGRLVFLAWEATTRRRVNPKVETWLNTAGVLAVLALILAVSVGDIMGLARGR